MVSGPPAVERSGADAAPPSMPDMNGEPTHGPTDETTSEGGLGGGLGGGPQGDLESSDDQQPPEGSAGRGDTEGHRLSARLTVGERVVVRYRLHEGSKAAATDFLGELVARNEDFLVLDTKTERVKLIRADVIAAKD